MRVYVMIMAKVMLMIYNNERATTENNTVVSNVTSIVKAIVSPVLMH